MRIAAIRMCAAIVACMVLWRAPVGAETTTQQLIVSQAAPVSGPPATAAPEAFGANPPEANTSQLGGLDALNRTMHSFNLWFWEAVEGTSSAWIGDTAIPEDAANGTRNFFGNLINEPISAVSWVVAGDYDNAWLSARRFWINTTRGWLGVKDVASIEGIMPQTIDLGLALCSWGMGEGGYIVLPFVGPRTVRDGLADFLLVNGLTYLALSPALGFPPSPQAFAVVEISEEVGRIAVMRQIDHSDDRTTSAQQLRDNYLASRRERCRQIVEARDNSGAASAQQKTGEVKP